MDILYQSIVVHLSRVGRIQSYTRFFFRSGRKFNTVHSTKMVNEESPLLHDEALDKAEFQPLKLRHESSLSTALDSFYRPEEEDNIDEECIPEKVQLLRLENIAIPCCYLLVGVTQGLSGILLNVYPLDLGATEAEQVTLSTVVVFPSTMKVLYGFLSDSVPILGNRRKPYMLLGYVLVSFSMLVLIFTSDLTLDIGGPIPLPPNNAPSVELLSACFFLLGVGLWLADVMGDSLVVSAFLYCIF